MPCSIRALHHTTASNGLLIQAAVPALVLLIGRVIFGSERARALQIVGVIASTIGVGWVVSQGEIDTLLHLKLGAGDALILGRDIGVVLLHGAAAPAAGCRPAELPCRDLHDRARSRCCRWRRMNG